METIDFPKLAGKALMFFIALLAVAFFLDPHIRFLSLWDAVLTTILLLLANNFLKPVLKIFTLPLSFISMGLAAPLANVGIIYLVSLFADGFIVGGVFWVWAFSLLVSLIFSGLLFVFENFFSWK